MVIADKSSRIGRVQLRIRRALIAANGKPVTIADLASNAHKQRFSDGYCG